MEKRRILIHVDTDPTASAFDAIVAIDAGVDHLLAYPAARPEQMPGIIQGAIFTRGLQDLKHTALFIGGRDVAAAQMLLKQAEATFFGPFRISILCDPNGANTTAAASVLLALRHLPSLAGRTALVLGGTGPVGSRIAHLLGRLQAQVLIGSRTYGRAQTTAQSLATAIGTSAFQPVVCAAPSDIEQVLSRAQLVFAAGAPSASFVEVGWLERHPHVHFAADLNAVPPAGLAGIEPTDCGRQSGPAVLYGAIGVGALKMKLHKHSLRQLFERNDRVLDIDEVFALGQALTS